MRLLIIVGPLLLAACTSASLPQVETHDEVGSTGTMFVANKRGASLSRIDLASGEETHRAETCENPHELTVSPDRLYVMVACYSGETTEIYATENLRKVGQLAIGERARVHSALWLDGGTVVAGAEGRGSLVIVGLTMMNGHMPPVLSRAETETGGPGPHLIAVDEARGRAWGTIIPTGEVVLYDLEARREVRRRKVGEQIEAIAISPDGEDLWVSSNTQNTAYRLDPEMLETRQSVATGNVPIRLAFHPSGDWMVSSNYGGGDLTVIDARRGEATRRIEVSGTQDAAQVTLVFSEDGRRLYAAETATDTIAEIDFATGEVLRRIATGPGGDGLAVID